MSVALENKKKLDFSLLSDENFWLLAHIFSTLYVVSLTDPSLNVWFVGITLSESSRVGILVLHQPGHPMLL